MTSNQQDLIVAKCWQRLQDLTDHRKLAVAFSGGVDSHVLLDLVVKGALTSAIWQVRAVHINHQLNPNAAQWAEHCQQICKAYAIPLTVINITVDCENGESLEACARAKRYAALVSQMDHDECLLTAHHQQDQAETLFLQLLRGAGPKGLSAMPVAHRLSNCMLLRPLLAWTPAQIKVYANKQSLEWIEDDSNQDIRFDRNYVRHRVVPTLEQRWPQWQATLSRSAQHCAEHCELVDELAVIDLSTAWCDAGKHKLKFSSLLELSVARQRNAFRYWLAINHCRLPQTKQLDASINELMKSRHDAMPVIKIDDYQIRRYRDILYLMPKSLYQHDPLWRKTWDLQGHLQLPAGLGVLSLTDHSSYSLRTDFAWHKIQVRFRQGGERICLQGAHSQSLKNLFQQWQVLPWLRDQVPLLFFEDQLIAVVGYAIACRFKQTMPGQQVRLQSAEAGLVGKAALV